MRKKKEITSEDLAGLLGRLSSDSDEAAKKYEKIHHGLINYFYYRGCANAEDLADETLNRVAMKLPDAPFEDDCQFIAYFYAFAANIYLEDRRKKKRFVPVYEITEPTMPAEENNAGILCMQSCLAKYPPDERLLLIKYYSFRKSERAGQRRLLAANLNTDIMSMQTRISRLRKNLRECLRKCLNRKKM